MNTMAMAMAASLTSAPSRAATVSARISGGNENSASIARMITAVHRTPEEAGDQAERNGEDGARPTISKAARSEMRAPQISRLRMSRPEIVGARASAPPRGPH